MCDFAVTKLQMSKSSKISIKQPKTINKTNSYQFLITINPSTTFQKGLTDHINPHINIPNKIPARNERGKN